jgi:hypothetical protein
MKKKTACAIVLACALTALGAMGLNWAGIIPLWLYEAVLVVDTPVFVIALGLWVMAGNADEDIPFIGY